MSRPDLYEHDLEPLIAGSARVKCQDEAELRGHQLRNERAGRILRESHDPFISDAAALFFAVVFVSFLSAGVLWWALGGSL